MGISGHSEGTSRDLVTQHDLPARAGGLVYLEPLQNYSVPSEDTGGIPAFWQLVRGRKFTLGAFAVLGTAAALAFSMVEIPVYEARTTLEFQTTGRSGESLVGLRDQATDGGVTPDYLETQVDVLQSKALARRVAAKLKKHADKYYVPDRLARTRALLEMQPSPTPGSNGRLPGVDIKIRVLPNSRIVEIACASADPRYAAEFADALASEYIDSNLESVWQTAQKTSDWLTRQLGDLRTKLEQSEAQLQAYTRNSALVYTGPNQNIDDDQLREVQKSLSDARADRIQKQSAYEIASKTPAESLPQVLDNGRLSEYQSKLIDLRRQYAELSALYTPSHYKVAQVQAQITDMENTLRRERSNIVNRIKNDYEAALHREKLLSAAYSAQLGRVSDQSRKAIYYGILKREVDTNQQIYDQLLQRVKQIGIGSALPTNNVRIIDNAEIPRLPVKPDFIRNGMMGFASGISLAFGLVLAGEFVNRSLRAPGEAPVHLKVPELGVIPSRNSVEDHALLPNLLPINSNVNGTDSKQRLELVTSQDPPSLLAEAYRNTLTSILAATPKSRPKVILITSSAHGEGKSTTVSNLGIALAEINQRVLLIDADLRKPHLHDIFNLSNTWGLSDLLREKTSLSECPLEGLARKSDIDGLYVLPSGPGTVSITNLLYSSRMAELVDRARSEFDITIIDTPPMSYLSDARVLGQLADGAVLVIRAARTTRDEARAAKQRLVDDGIKVLGTILNAWDSRAKARYGYSAYTS